MNIQRINIEPIKAHVKEPSKARRRKTPKTNHRPSSPPPAETTLSDRNVRCAIKCFNGTLSLACMAFTAIFGLTAYDRSNDRQDKCAYNPSTCHPFDLENLLSFTWCACGVATASLGIFYAKKLCSQQELQ